VLWITTSLYPFGPSRHVACAILLVVPSVPALPYATGSQCHVGDVCSSGCRGWPCRPLLILYQGADTCPLQTICYDPAYYWRGPMPALSCGRRYGSFLKLKHLSSIRPRTLTQVLLLNSLCHSISTDSLACLCVVLFLSL